MSTALEADALGRLLSPEVNLNHSIGGFDASDVPAAAGSFQEPGRK